MFGSDGLSVLLFVLVVALICLGIAWGLSTAGISLALGAFVAEEAA